MWLLIYAVLLFTLAVSVFLYQLRKVLQPHKWTCVHSHSTPYLSFCCLWCLFTVAGVLNTLLPARWVMENTNINILKNTSQPSSDLCDWPWGNVMLCIIPYLKYLLDHIHSLICYYIQGYVVNYSILFNIPLLVGIVYSHNMHIASKSKIWAKNKTAIYTVLFCENMSLPETKFNWMLPICKLYHMKELLSWSG